MYAYVRNNPTTFTDPSGLSCTVNGKTYNWLWCGLHTVGLVETQYEAANDARESLSKYSLYRNGKKVDLSKESDQSVLNIRMQVSLQEFDANRPEAILGLAPPQVPGYSYIEKPNVTNRELQDVVDDLF